MTDQHDRDLTRAIEHFIAEILAMAQRVAIDVIRSAFAATASGERRRSRQSAHRRAAASFDPSTVSARMIALVREHPGWSTAQISQSLGLHTGVTRQHLRHLADQGVIRIEEASLGGITRRTYFRVSHGDEPSAAQTGRASTTAVVA